uniref:Uncharacterized protein n=1 Tax=Anopheles arabiensis TaxID=7173 RepID=A0A182IG29_ANOAR
MHLLFVIDRINICRRSYFKTIRHVLLELLSPVRFNCHCLHCSEGLLAV